MENSKSQWWELDDSENLWIEITDRDDIGSNLKAPVTNQKGDEYWSYSFLKSLQPGDIIFHYDKKHKAIVGKSQVAEHYKNGQIKWAARGTVSRKAGIRPYWREGWIVALANHHIFEKPRTIQSIIENKDKIKLECDRLKTRHGEPLYFPFELGDKRPPRPMQGYLFKFPKFMLDIFPELGND
tara:strand:- start:48 stop:596 length:549 start_codon:yes stop_codon:yes gene_type:complete